jgi:hypothetical protein
VTESQERRPSRLRQLPGAHAQRSERSRFLALLLAYSLCLTRLLALITTALPLLITTALPPLITIALPPLILPAFAPPVTAPMLLLVSEDLADARLPLLAKLAAFDAARCITNLAMTFEREILGFLAGTTRPSRVGGSNSIGAGPPTELKALSTLKEVTMLAGLFVTIGRVVGGVWGRPGVAGFSPASAPDDAASSPFVEFKPWLML